MGWQGQTGLCSYLDDESVRIFNDLLDADQESHGFFTIDDSMVVRQGDIHHRSNHDAIIDDNRSLFDLMQAEDT
jgi:hypothetical protein